MSNYLDMLQALFDILASDNTISHNRILSHAIGNLETQMYQCLISKMNYYAKNGKLDNDGFFYATVYDIEESTTLTPRQQLPIARKLEEIGLIQTAKKGIPAKKYYKIINNPQLLIDLVKKGNQKIMEIQEKREHEKMRSENNRNKKNNAVNRINPQYEQNVCTCSTKNDNSEKTLKPAVSHSTNKMSVLVQTESPYLYKQDECTGTNKKSVLVQTKSPYINLYNNKTNINNLSINQSNDRKIDAEYEEYKELIKENILYDDLTNSTFKLTVDELDEVVELMTELVAVNKTPIKINGTEVPSEIIKSRFLTLKEGDIIEFFNRYKSVTDKINNPRAYMISILFNLKTTTEHYYTNQVISDMHE